MAALLTVLADDAQLLVLVPADDIGAGPRPLNGSLPALTLGSISKVDRNLPSPGAGRHARERVQVTAMGRNYPEMKAILRAVRHAAADKLYPVVTGISNVTIHTESAGPDFIAEDASIWLGSQDFLVTYTETR